MKSLTAKLAIILTALVAMPSFATVQTMTIDWKTTIDNSGVVVYKQSYSNEEKYFNAKIGHSIVGRQNIYFTDSYNSNKSMCKLDIMYKYGLNEPQRVTMIFNGQAVKIIRMCRKFSDANSTYYEYTPQTDIGHSYVVNLFKTSLTPIKVQFDNETLYVPVRGFTRAWNSAGGNAI
ncbi:MAG: hypothetical protein KGV51_05065 [Moraxellaceae bacterium]|nr:hypothetical protein [Moraxellaceae bacterium]